MSTEIQIFNFESEENQIRIIGTADDPKFCLADICKVLGLTAKHVRERLEDEVVSTDPIIDRLGRVQQMLFVNEDGFYDVVLESRKPIARKFRKWVTKEVLPSIRKTGAYIQPEKIEESTDGYVPKFFSGMKVFTLRDVSDILKMRYEYLRRLLNTPQRAKLEEGRDYLKLIGGLLKGFVNENPSVSSSTRQLIVVFESGFNKICEYFKMKVSSIFSSDSGEITLNFEEKKEQAKTYFYDGANRAKEKIKDYLKVQGFLIEEHERLKASLKSLQLDEPLVHSLKDLKNVISYIGIRIVTESCELEPISK